MKYTTFEENYARLEIYEDGYWMRVKYAYPFCISIAGNDEAAYLDTGGPLGEFVIVKIIGTKIRLSGTVEGLESEYIERDYRFILGDNK